MADAAPAESKGKAVAKASKTGAGDGAVDNKKRFEVKKWNAVALWAWDIVVDNCAICRNHIMDLCKTVDAVTRYALTPSQVLNVKRTRALLQLKNVRSLGAFAM